MGNPTGVSEGMTVVPDERLQMITRGELLGDPSTLSFRSPDTFRSGELHSHLEHWEKIVDKPASPEQLQVLSWIRDKVCIHDYFRPFCGQFKGKHYDSAQPPRAHFRNNPSCRPFAEFIHKTLVTRVRTKAISVLGRVGSVEPPYLVLPLTIEPSKPRLCHDARFCNLWMKDMPFKLDKLVNVTRYVRQDSYQTILDDKSGYDHILLSEESRAYFGIQWGGWYFVYNTLPFGWKISPFVYHSTGLVASNFFRSIGIPCTLYIDDRHNGQLQVDLNQGVYGQLSSTEERNLAAAKSAIFLVGYHLIQLGYFLGLAKSILMPAKRVPYLGFVVDSSHQAFDLIPAKRQKFINLVREILQYSAVSVKTLQRLVGKCVSLSIAVPGALLFTREMNHAVSRGLRSHRQVKLDKNLREEISHWLFLESWDEPVPWKNERHLRIRVSSDASGSGWGASVNLDEVVTASDYWSEEEQQYDIAAREALALDKTLVSFAESLRNSWVDAHVDNMAVVHAWQKQGGRSVALNRIMKQLFFTTLRLNISLHVSYVATGNNPADAPSRRLSVLDSRLHPDMWSTVEKEFGGPDGHTCDLMALDSNAMLDKEGVPLPHFTPHQSPASAGVNFFSQDLRAQESFLDRPYIFPPLSLVGPVVRFLQSEKKNCTMVTLTVYPRKYWWPLLVHCSSKCLKLAEKGSTNALLVPTKDGWVPHQGIPGDLWAFALTFN